MRRRRLNRPGVGKVTRPAKVFYKYRPASSVQETTNDDWSGELNSSRSGWRSELRRYIADMGGDVNG